MRFDLLWHVCQSQYLHHVVVQDVVCQGMNAALSSCITNIAEQNISALSIKQPFSLGGFFPTSTFRVSTYYQKGDIEQESLNAEQASHLKASTFTRMVLSCRMLIEKHAAAAGTRSQCQPKRCCVGHRLLGQRYWWLQRMMVTWRPMQWPQYTRTGTAASCGTFRAAMSAASSL